MQIISSFRDYYDSAPGFDTDDRLIYRREPAHLTFPVPQVPPPSAVRYVFEKLSRKDAPDAYQIGDYRFQLGVLCFCGALMPIALKRAAIKTFDFVPSSEAPEFLDLAQFISELKAIPPHVIRSEAKDRYDHNRKREWIDVTLPELEREMAAWIPRRGPDEFFRSIGAPVALVPRFRRFSLKEWGCHTNIRLKDYRFGLEAMKCYQTIETYLGSVLAEPDIAPLRVGSDEVIARQKGFDELSFRTAAPGRKKVNRQVNRERKRGL